MAKAEQVAAIRNVQILFEVGTTGGLTDRQLLEQFRDHGGEAGELAFVALVERHGPLVLRVCRSILRDEHTVEDSFQATFLILVRRAGILWVRDSLGPWLYQVAYRVASSARSAAARRRRYEQPLIERADPAVHDPEWSDLGPLVHEELARLPERYRAPIVLCCMEGLTHQQAAGRLGWPVGTLESRLVRGRQRMRGRLIRRGLAPTAGLVGAVLGAERARAAVSAELLNSTIRTMVQFAAGKLATSGVASVSVAALTEGVFKAMFLHKLRTILGAVAVVAVTSTGLGVWAQHVLRVDHRAAIQVESPLIAQSETPSLAAAEPRSWLESDEETAVESRSDQADPPAEKGEVTRGDGNPDGKNSLGGSGEMLRAGMPPGASKLTSLKIHGSRYGQPQPPEESFLIYFLSDDLKRILHTEMAPYSLFERGPEEWVKVNFDPPIAGLPKAFWIVLDFRATQTKGVYVSYDTSTQGEFSRVGLPGTASSQVKFGGDWMIRWTFVE